MIFSDGIILPQNVQEELAMSYDDYVQYLLRKYGTVPYDYFVNSDCKTKNIKNTRTRDGLFCHHIDEDKEIMLSNPEVARMCPFEYQKADRLVYCTILEHLILHIKIAEADKNSSLGIGGAEMIWKQINGYYTIKKVNGWRKPAFCVIDDKYDDYIFVMRYLRDVIANDTVMSFYYSKPQLATNWNGNIINKILKDIYET